MSSTQFLIDGASRHAVFVQRYAGGLENQYSDELANALERVIEAILNYDDSSPILLNTLRADIGRQLSSDIGVIGDDLFGTLIEFADSEGEFSAELFQQAVSADVVPTPSMVAPLRNTLMNVEAGGITIGDALSAFSAAKVEQVDNIISDGFLNGQTSQQVAQSLRNVIPLPRNQMRSLVRTATNAASSMARNETMRANADIFTGYEWVATLDSHTSFICMGRDGNIYEIGVGPLPPAHWGCRSTTIPKIDPRFDLASRLSGHRPSSGANGAQQVGGNVTYGGWLRTQPAAFQDEVLGRSRGRLLRSGGLTVDSFTNDSGQTYTLDQLRALNPLAFERANL